MLMQTIVTNYGENEGEITKNDVDTSEIEKIVLGLY